MEPQVEGPTEFGNVATRCSVTVSSKRWDRTPERCSSDHNDANTGKTSPYNPYCDTCPQRHTTHHDSQDLEQQLRVCSFSTFRNEEPLLCIAEIQGKAQMDPQTHFHVSQHMLQPAFHPKALRAYAFSFGIVPVSAHIERALPLRSPLSRLTNSERGCCLRVRE